MNKIKITFLALLFLVVLGCSSNNEASDNEQSIDNIETRSINEEMIIDNEFRLVINKIYETDERNILPKPEEGKTQKALANPEKVYKIQYTYESLNPEADGFYVLPSGIISNYDEKATQYPLYEINHPTPIAYGETCVEAETSFSFDKTAKSVQFYFVSAVNDEYSTATKYEDVVYEYFF